MYIISEDMVQQLIDNQSAFEAVESVFSSMACGDAYNFPVIREAIGYADALYGFKSGFDKKAKSLGLKSGGYWPTNTAKGLTNHQSTVILFDADSGKPHALVGGNYLTAIRTAAASAVSIQHLAHHDAKVIGMIGAGHQSTFQLQAALQQRSFEKVIGWNKDPSQLAKLDQIARNNSLPFQSVDREQLCAQADVIITITSCHEPLLMHEWVAPGTHIACMGTDTKGKQEVDENLVANASLFTDEIAQSIELGECQHAYRNSLINEADISMIGSVINGDHPGRINNDQITLFDGTGVGLQDLAVATKSVQLALEKNLAQKIEL